MLAHRGERRDGSIVRIVSRKGGELKEQTRLHDSIRTAGYWWSG
jgi:hypothetical protein